MQRRYTDNTTAAVLYPTDVVTHVINIDSRFRNNPQSTPSTDFIIKLPKSYKNITSLCLTSVEIPNMWYEFTAIKGNITMIVTDPYNTTPTQTLKISEGNYATVDELALAVVTQMNIAFGYPVATGSLYGYTYTLDNVTNKITISFQGAGVGQGPLPFSIVFPQTGRRPFDNGLGYYLGFSAQSYSGHASYTAEHFAVVIGDNYMFMELGSYEAVETTTFADTAMSAFAKIIISSPKNDIIYDNGNNLVSKRIPFSQPQNISQLRIRLINCYGDTIVMPNNISLTLEAAEIVNSTLYETYRQRITNV